MDVFHSVCDLFIEKGQSQKYILFLTHWLLPPRTDVDAIGDAGAAGVVGCDAADDGSPPSPWSAGWGLGENTPLKSSW